MLQTLGSSFGLKHLDPDSGSHGLLYPTWAELCSKSPLLPARFPAGWGFWQPLAGTFCRTISKAGRFHLFDISVLCNNVAAPWPQS